VVGPKGAGKSTLVGLLAGDLRPSAGEVRLAGRPVGAYRPRELARLRAVLPQQTVLQFAFTVEQVVTMGRSAARSRLGPEEERAAVRRCMADAEVLDLAARRFPTLSGGERARVTLARVLAQGAPALLLDEPTAALDLRHQGLVMGLAARLAREGRAIVAVLHDLNLAAAHADRVAVLCEGRLETCGRPWEALRPERLRRVFGHPVRVLPHPERDCPLVVPAVAADRSPRPSSPEPSSARSASS
jgi:iron complex transport system ATP-binding protein